jgi:hypothetical protein
MALSAYFSRSISPRVLTPRRRNSGSGGHQPCNACCSRNTRTPPVSVNHLLSTVRPSKSPVNANDEALASRTRSTSHSLSSSLMRSRITSRLAPAYHWMLQSVCRSISTLTWRGVERRTLSALNSVGSSACDAFIKISLANELEHLLHPDLLRAEIAIATTKAIIPFFCSSIRALSHGNPDQLNLKSCGRTHSPRGE